MINSNRKMASNIPINEDESVRVPPLDMTRGSLQDILDSDEGNSIDASRHLPQVPQVPLNTTHLQNATLGDIIQNRDLGVLSSFKITDADIIIRNLQSQLSSAVEKNDASTSLLQRMDNRQKQLEAHLTEQTAEMAKLREEREVAVREKRDYTVNQQRLEENIRRNLEKEYADREKIHIKQLEKEMTAKVESKTAAVRDQYHTELSLELERLKTEWTQERETIAKRHNEQLAQILKEVEALKEQSRLKQPERSEPGDKVAGLKTSAFNFVPGTVNTKRGGAAELHEETIAWSKYSEPPPVPPRKVDEKRVHFTSTPCRPAQPNLIDLDDEHCTTIHAGNPFTSHSNNPFIQPEVPVSNLPIPSSSDATTLLGNTMTAVASEFKKMREPKLAKLKGGTTANATLFFNSWVKDARAIITERSMNNYESLQLVKDYTEGKARAQVEFYLVSTTNPTFEGLIQDLAKSFQSGEDEATIKRDFYSRVQLSKESVDDFADVLQLLARKILNVDSSFQALLNKSLCQQLANGLKDPSHGISARQILKQQPEISFVAFRSDLANILGCRARGVGAKGALSSAVSAESPEAPVPAKRRRTQEDDSIATQINMCIKDNQELHRKLDALDPSKMVDAVAQAVASGYQKGFQRSNPFTKSTNPFQATSQSQPSTSGQYGRPYLGQAREPQLTPGADGNLNPALSCKYCKDTGHEVGNCAKVKRKEALKAAAAMSQSAPKPKGN